MATDPAGGGGALTPSNSASAPAAAEGGGNLADVLERVLDKGVVIAGDIRVNLLDIELLTIKLRLIVALSPVSLDEFGAEPLKRNLEDMGWLERTARAHQAVLDRVLSSAAIVPMRLFTIFSDDAHVREMLEREEEVLLTTLERLRDHSEWSVKVLADRARVQAAARGRSGASATSEPGAEGAGRAYLARKKAERGLRE